MLWIIIGDVGAGKTILTVIKAIEFSDRKPKSRIFANFHLKGFKNFEFNPLCFFPFDKLQDTMIIIDDIYGKKNYDNYTGMCVNVSRKLDLEMYITCQDDIFVPAVLRRMAYLIYPTYIKELDLLIFSKYREKYDRIEHKIIRRNYGTFIIENAVKIAGNRFNTYEIVAEPLESEYLAEIKRISKTDKDIERNINLFTKNKTDRKRLKRELFLEWAKYENNREVQNSIY